LAERGTGLLEIAALLNHANVKTTQIYTRMSAHRLRQTIERASPLMGLNTPSTPLLDSLRKGKR
jgi:site-specific recombinase XerD